MAYEYSSTTGEGFFEIFFEGSTELLIIMVPDLSNWGNGAIKVNGAVHADKERVKIEVNHFPIFFSYFYIPRVCLARYDSL